MPTKKQSASSRANSQKSTGPRTAQGKAASRFNALKHGIDAKSQVIQNEAPKDLANLAAEYYEQHAPANATERFLVDTLIDNEWHLRRLRRVRAELWLHVGKFWVDDTDYATDNDSDEEPEKVGHHEWASSGATFSAADQRFERLQRIVNSCQRTYSRALKELQVARGQARRAPQPEPSKPTSDSPASFRQNAPAPPNPFSEGLTDLGAGTPYPVVAHATCEPLFASKSSIMSAQLGGSGSVVADRESKLWPRSPGTPTISPEPPPLRI